MPTKAKSDVTKCAGGISHGCNRTAHTRGKYSYNCRNCKQYLGCSACSDKANDIVCNHCKDWGTDGAERKHGKMVKDQQKRASAMKIVMMRYDRQISEGDANRLFSELWSVR